MYDYPYQPEVYQYEEACESLFSAELASIIKFPPADGGNKGDLTYAQLACNEQDASLIHELISTLGETGTVGLLFKKGHLGQLGAQINHVHPLKFLSTVFNNASLSRHMTDIYDDHFKWNGFIDGLGATLTRESEKGKLDNYIKDFAADLGVPQENIRKYFQSRDWDGLVLYLIRSRE